MDGRLQVDSVYTDFKKAFDKVDHIILLKKMAQYGIHGDLLRLIESYLTDRLMTVTLNGFNSRYVTVTSGVPQGSVLGPLLFAIFINDINSCFLHSHFLLFADDLKIFRRIESEADAVKLNEDLTRVYDYCIKNKLELNLKKCNSITFTKNKKVFKHTYVINGYDLVHVSQIRDLGVIFDCKLHFDVHVEELLTGCNATLGFILRASSDFRSCESLLQLFITLVRSKLEYCSPVWNPFYEKYVTTIEKFQRKFVRICERRFQYFDSSKLMSLSKRRELIDTCTLQKICVSAVDVPSLLTGVGLRVPSHRRYHKPFISTRHLTNAGFRNPLHRMLRVYNDNYSEVDIFAATPYTFKKSILSKMLTLESE
jgi:hypothetical protein